MTYKCFRLILIAIIVLLACGRIYQTAGVRLDAKQYLPVGKLYSIGRDKMHLYTGGSGDVTVVFAAGWGTVNPVVDFYPLYEETATYAKYVVYDRFGYGYSELTSRTRQIDTMIDEIHELLGKASLKPSYILVGHSLASLECIRYAQRYPEEVKGIVLIDGGNPEFYANAKPITWLSYVQGQLVNFGIARLLYKIDGFDRFSNSERNQLRLLPEDLKRVDKLATLLKANNRNITDEMKRSQENAKVVIGGGRIDAPLTIITSGDFGNASKAWLASQHDLLSWSTMSKQVVVNDSRHYIHHYHPEIIIKEIVELRGKTGR